MIYGSTVISDAGSLGVKPVIQLRTPRTEDGPSVWRMIEATPSLDKNSLYCNLLQCSHFASTCAVAELDGVVAGWMSGYVPPDRSDTLFVWQICVAPQVQRRSVARKLIGSVLARVTSGPIRYIGCTITQGNTASWGLFGSVARTLKAQMSQAEHFQQHAHFGGAHDGELAVSIGPFEHGRVAALSA